MRRRPVGSGIRHRGGSRTIEVSALDELAFEPASVEVTAGETVRFVVTNDGANDHEFVVGHDEAQDRAEEQAMEGMHGHVDAMASLAVGPGETAETTVTFTDAGELFLACHLTGHFEAGMVGTITVTRVDHDPWHADGGGDAARSRAREP